VAFGISDDEIVMVEAVPVQAAAAVVVKPVRLTNDVTVIALTVE
jgi:hypothetical protein